jgi:hypothetical protein
MGHFFALRVTARREEGERGWVRGGEAVLRNSNSLFLTIGNTGPVAQKGCGGGGCLP